MADLFIATTKTDDFTARSSDELTLAKGDRVELIERDDEFGDGWFLGKHMVNGNSGLFPEGTSTFDVAPSCDSPAQERGVHRAEDCIPTCMTVHPDRIFNHPTQNSQVNGGASSLLLLGLPTPTVLLVPRSPC